MPPAFVLSQDQTLKFDVPAAPRWNIPKHNELISRSRSCTNTSWKRVRTYRTAYSFTRAPDALKPPDPEPPPTCPFININNVKEPKTQDNRSFPRYQGDQRPTLSQQPQSVGTQMRPRRCGEAAYMEGLPTRQQPFCNFLSIDFRGLRTGVDRSR